MIRKLSIFCFCLGLLSCSQKPEDRAQELIHESWKQFQKGSFYTAIHLLDDAENIWFLSDDYKLFVHLAKMEQYSERNVLDSAILQANLIQNKSEKGDYYFHYAEAKQAQFSNKIPAFLAHLDSAYAVNPSKSEANICLCQYALGLIDTSYFSPETALPFCIQGYQSDPGDYNLYLLTYNYFILGEYKIALRECKKLETSYPDDPMIFYMMTISAYQLMDDVYYERGLEKLKMMDAEKYREAYLQTHEHESDTTSTAGE